MSKTPPVCSYEDSNYRSDFWEGKGREYEDRVERVALARLLPRRGSTLIEVGAGFGRLANEYTGYDTVVLFDYSRTLLRDAKTHLGDDPRYRFVAGNFYELPFVDGLFETIVQVRSLHHAADPQTLFRQVARVVRPRGHYILEYANKRNLKAMLRYALRRQKWSPFTREPYEFLPLHFDFHPRWINAELARAGFMTEAVVPVSYLRIALLKRALPTAWLVAADALLQRTGRLGLFSPSIFTRNRASDRGPVAGPERFFACPKCGQALDDADTLLPCEPCGLGWKKEDGIYDFKEPVPL